MMMIMMMMMTMMMMVYYNTLAQGSQGPGPHPPTAKAKQAETKKVQPRIALPMTCAPPHPQTQPETKTIWPRTHSAPPTHHLGSPPKLSSIFSQASQGPGPMRYTQTNGQFDFYIILWLNVFVIYTELEQLQTNCKV